MKMTVVDEEFRSYGRTLVLRDSLLEGRWCAVWGDTVPGISKVPIDTMDCDLV
jgi:hypothetical protein